MKPDTIREFCAALADADAASYRKVGYLAISDAIQSLAQVIRQAPLTCVEINRIPPEGSLIHLLRWDATPEGKMQARPDGRFVMLDALEISLRDLDAGQPAAPAVKVKPLVWHDCTDGTSHDTLCQYEIDRQSHSTFGHRLLRAATGGTSYLSHHATLTEAKAAAQADYKARILAVLEGVKP